jgi:hypothetical protein
MGAEYCHHSFISIEIAVRGKNLVLVLDINLESYLGGILEVISIWSVHSGVYQAGSSMKSGGTRCSQGVSRQGLGTCPPSSYRGTRTR